MGTILNKNGGIYRIIVVVLLVSVFLTACNPYDGRRPYEYINSVWICETPYIYASVDEYGEITAYIGKDEDKQYIDLCFDFGTGLDAIKAGETNVSEYLLFSGDCEFRKMSFTVVIVEDNLWDGEYSQLKFTRIK